MTVNNKPDKKFENFFEELLELQEKSTSEEETKRLQTVIDELYKKERVNAHLNSKDKKNTMGFSYFMKEYQYYERCLNFVSSQMVYEILNHKENVEWEAHDKFPSYSKLNDDGAHEFLYGVIERHDEDLATFVRDHDVIFGAGEVEHAKMAFSSVLDKCLDHIRMNWFIFADDKKDFESLTKELSDFYDEHSKESKLEFSTILIHILKSNEDLANRGLNIGQFNKYYVMEDTNLEESKALVDQNDICRFDNISDKKLIDEMNMMVRKHYAEKEKRDGRPLLFEID